MADITKLPALKYLQLGDSTTPVFRLFQSIDSTTTTVKLNGSPVDETGAALTSEVYYITTIKSDGNTETMKVTATSGNTLTVVRGIRRGGLDIDTGDSSNAFSHSAGQVVVCSIHPSFHEMLSSALQGLIATGANTFKIGDQTDSDVYIYADNGDANLPYVRYDAGTSSWFYSDDGTTDSPMGGAGSLTAGDGIDITTGVVSVDLATSNDLLKFTGGEVDTNLTSTKAEIDQLAGTTNIAEADTFFGSTDITGAEAETLSNGGDASDLHLHNVTTGVTTSTVNNGSTLNITHSLGKTPRRVKLTAVSAIGNNDGGHPIQVTGWTDGTNQHSVAICGTATGGLSIFTFSATSSTSKIFRATIGSSGTTTYTLEGTAVLTSSQIQLSFTVSPSFSIGFQFLWEAYA